MDHSLQLLLFVLICLFSYLIYKMAVYKINTEKGYDISIDSQLNEKPKITIKRTREIPPPNPPKNLPPTKKQTTKNPYEEWNRSWLSRNTSIKTCYNNCSGLRTNDYIRCSEKCLSQDRFGK